MVATLQAKPWALTFPGQLLPNPLHVLLQPSTPQGNSHA